MNKPEDLLQYTSFKIIWNIMEYYAHNCPYKCFLKVFNLKKDFSAIASGIVGLKYPKVEGSLPWNYTGDATEKSSL